MQFLVLASAAEHPEVVGTNTWQCLDALAKEGILRPEAHQDLLAAYDFQRTLESRLRIVHNRSASGLPEDRSDLERLVARLRYAAGDGESAIEAFRADRERHAERARYWFGEVVGRAAE
jgi:glutamate-ammonia-ligase adenylyltransferase